MLTISDDPWPWYNSDPYDENYGWNRWTGNGTILRLERRNTIPTDTAYKLISAGHLDAESFVVRANGNVTCTGDLSIGGKLNLGTRTIQGPDDPSDYYDSYLLSVDGTVIATEVIVSDKDEDWMPDYVFNDDYNLMPLDELEKNIDINKHLPGIPSAKEVAENGMKLADMNNKLLLKIEELTLYVIQLQKQIDSLKELKGN